MVRKRVRVRETRRVAIAWGLGLAVYLLASMIPGWAQQENPTPASPQVVAPKETSTPTPSPEQPKTPISDYTVSPEDLLEVLVMDVPEVSRTYRVSSNGFLTLPLLPQPIPAAA